VGGELEQAIDFTVACCVLYPQRKEKKCTDVFKVTRNTRMLDALMTMWKLKD